MLPNSSLSKLILFFITAAVIVLGVLLFFSPAAIFPDPSWGFQVLRSMQMGGGFNMMVKPDQRDIAKNTTEFLTWWSPGQYLAPYLFKTLFQVNTGQAAAITTAICQLMGLAGFYSFFKKAGFSQLISTLSLVLIVCQQAFFSPYIFYSGGEILIFAFSGWFLYGCMALDKPGVRMVLFVLLSGWIGFFCKSSFIWMYAAGLLFMWIRLSRGRQNIKDWIFKGLWPGIPAVASVAGIYFFYLSKGINPSSSSEGWKLGWETFAFPLASPLLSGFSADDLANGLIYHNDMPIFNPAWSIIILLLLAVLSVVLVRAILKQVPHQDYKLMLIIFYGIAVLFFSYAFLHRLAISYEARHFRLIGLLILPGTISLFRGFKQIYQVALGLAALFIISFSLLLYVGAYQRTKDDSPRGVSGIAQQFIDQPSLDYITMLDNKNRNAVFVFLSPDLGLEVVHNRVITLPPLGPDIRINFEEYVYRGHAGPVYILLPSKYMGIKASVMLKCFPDYKGFKLKEISDDYVLYYTDTYR